MPIFEYECNVCKKRFEMILSFVNSENREGMLHRSHELTECHGFLWKVPSVPRFNSEFPTQSGGVHSMAGFGKRSRNRQGD